MATAQTLVTAKPQLIPTNAGERTFATPPEAMQGNIVPQRSVLHPQPLEGRA